MGRSSYENFINRKGAKDAKNPIFHKIGRIRFYEIPLLAGRLRRVEVGGALKGFTLASRQRRDYANVGCCSLRSLRLCGE
jgi:hypothetical protein